MKDAEIFLQEIKTFREKHKIIDVPFILRPPLPTSALDHFQE
jgi:hypothetical protein